MARSRSSWLLALGLGFILAGCYRPTNSSSPGVKSSFNGTAQVGGPAPDISGDDADGKPMRLSDYRDKVVMLDFWATW
jgi:cytochrome oxidase Cu insertion factor (SCO1/SenC/PrrC family)